VSPNRFVILDRDGTLIAETNSLSNPAQVDLLPNTATSMHGTDLSSELCRERFQPQALR
jgi:histidinol phosphatase-like enzyme